MKKLMLRLKQKHAKHLRVNMWGVIAYTLSIASYVLLGIVLFRYFQNSSVLQYPSSPVTTSPTSPGVDSSVSALGLYFGYGVTAVIIVLAAVMFVSFPYILSRYYARALHRILNMLPGGVSRRSLFYAKAIAGVVPLGGFMIIALADQYFDSVFAFCYVAAVVLVALAECVFYIQFRAARRARVAARYIW